MEPSKSESNLGQEPTKKVGPLRGAVARRVKELHILLVGRNRDLLGMLASVLASRGATIAVATDVDEAVRCIRRACPDVVIYDRGPSDPELNPTHVGFKGRLLILTDESMRPSEPPGLTTVIRKPVALDVLIEEAMQVSHR
jgi:PleD family two-component response regulator